MVVGKTPVSLIRVVLALGALAAARAASAQPSELFTCLFLHNAEPTCYRVGGAITFASECQRAFVHYLGRIAWYPLTYVGPIEVAVETASSPYDQFPLYVEIVPLDGVDPADVCENAPGYVLMTLYPNRSRPDPCVFWETSGVVDLSSVVPVGGTYALRLHYFRHPVPIGNSSPGVDCVRITAHPPSAAVTRESWARVKCLYR